MTPMHVVSTADQQLTSSTTLRISEVVSPPMKSPGQSQPVPHADLLRAGSRYLQAGWRWLESRRAQQLSSRRLRLTETISLGEKRSVSIVQVDGAQFLIGCSTGSVQLLAVLDKQNDASKRSPGTADIESAA